MEIHSYVFMIHVFLMYDHCCFGGDPIGYICWFEGDRTSTPKGGDKASQLSWVDSFETDLMSHRRMRVPIDSYYSS